jgi:Ino eighty subunit 2
MAFITLYYTQAARRRKADLDSSSSTASSPAPSRPRRSGGSAITTTSTSSASVQRGSAWPDDRRHSLKLTVKAPPSKLREVMRANEVDTLKDTLGGGQVLDGPRSSRRAALAARSNTRNNQRPAYAEFDESELDVEEEDEEEEEEEEVEEDDAMNDFDALGAEAEGGTDDEDDQDDEDVDMEDAAIPPPKRHAPPTAPKITLKPPARKSDGKQTPKSKVVVTSASVGAVKSVEDQEMEDDPDDEEVEASSDLTDEDDEDDETNANVNDEDAEAEEDEVEVEVEETTLAVEDEDLDEDDEDEDSLDDSDGTPASGSATPDLAKMTKRQRGRAEDQNTLMALDMAPQQRKVSTLLQPIRRTLTNDI